MATADTRAAFARAAAGDGVVLERATFDWLCEQGHVGLERVAKARRDPAIVAPVVAALHVLERICARLRGDVTVLHSARKNLLLPCDLVHLESGTIVEVDGPEHFSSARLAALGLYPRRCGRRVRRGRARGPLPRAGRRTDLLSRGLPAKAFGFGGVLRERAYNDALRDLATPAMGHPPLIRIAAADGDGAAAYARHRRMLAALAAA